MPDGMGPGSTFAVEFSDDAPPEKELAPGPFVPTVVARPEIGAEVLEDGDTGGREAVASATTGPYVPAAYAPFDAK